MHEIKCWHIYCCCRNWKNKNATYGFSTFEHSFLWFDQAYFIRDFSLVLFRSNLTLCKLSNLSDEEKLFLHSLYLQQFQIFQLLSTWNARVFLINHCKIRFSVFLDAYFFTLINEFVFCTYFFLYGISLST